MKKQAYITIQTSYSGIRRISDYETKKSNNEIFLISGIGLVNRKCIHTEHKSLINKKDSIIKIMDKSIKDITIVTNQVSFKDSREIVSNKIEYIEIDTKKTLTSQISSLVACLNSLENEIMIHLKPFVIKVATKLNHIIKLITRC